MKFSLKLLLAITLLAVLAVNGTNNLHQAKLIRENCLSLEAETGIIRNRTQSFQEKKLLYTRASDAFERRRERISNSSDAYFLRLSRALSIPKAQDRSKMHVSAFSGKNERGTIVHAVAARERFRIWLPKSPKFELCLGFHEHVTERTSETMRDSYYFSPKDMFTVPLDIGESLIEFSINVQGKNHVEVVVNGTVVHRASRYTVMDFGDLLTHKSGYSVDTSQQNIFEPETLTLVTASLWQTRDEPESVSLLIRPINEEQ